MKALLRNLKTWQILLIFLSILLLINYTTYGVVFAPVNENEFILKNFLIYNFSYKAFINLVKITCIGFIVLAGSLLLGVKIKTGSVFKAVILSKLIYFARQLIVIGYAFSSWGTYSKEELMAFNKKTFLFFAEKDSGSMIYQFLSLFSLYDLTFVALLIFSIKSICMIEWSKSSKIIGSSYIPAMVIYALFMIFLGAV